MEEKEIYLQGIYQHYKGKEYEVVGTALSSDTKKAYVIYRSIEDSVQWIRDYDEFIGMVEHEGEMVERFKLLGLLNARVYIENYNN